MSSEPIRGIPPDWKRHDDVMVVQGALPWTRDPSIMEPIWKAGITGKGIKVINLDTGYRKHVDLPEPIKVRNFTTSNASDVTDRHGHGNHTIGSVVGRNGLSAAPEADLIVGKVLGDNGSGANTVAALNWAAEQDADIVTCSWGSDGPLDSASNEACKRIEASGKWLFFAAGNAGYNGRNTVGSPAQSVHCAAVSSVNSDGTLSGFSSGGPRVDMAAGGGGIISAGLNDNRVLMSGTSMATPTAASDGALLRQTFNMLGMRTNLPMRELIKFLASEKFLKDAGSPGRDPMYGDGLMWTRDILAWITSKLKDLAVAIMLCLTIAAAAQGQILDTSPIDIPQKQVTFLKAQSVQLIQDGGKVLILAEGLETEREFAVLLSVGSKVLWAEIHDEAKPFPPRIQKPDEKGQVVVVGKANQAFFVSLRSNEPPQWVRVVVAPSGPTNPTDPPPPVGDFTALTVLSKTKAATLDRETGLLIRQALLNKLNDLESRCKAGLCPTYEQAKKEVIESINATAKNQRYDWYGGWRMPISEALIALKITNTPTYIAAMRAAAAGLE